MAGTDLIRLFMQQASAQGSRSTAMNPLGWALTINSAAIIGAGVEQLPAWVMILLGVGEGLTLVSYLAAYFFLLVRDRDALRSEKFQLSKMAIERSITGDNLTGFIEPDKQPLAIPGAEPKEAKE